MCGDGFFTDLQLFNRFFIGLKKTVDHQGLGHQVAVKDDLLFAFVDVAQFGLPAIGGYDVSIVLHGFVPVGHQVLVYIVFIDQVFSGITFKQIF